MAFDWKKFEQDMLNRCTEMYSSEGEDEELTQAIAELACEVAVGVLKHYNALLQQTDGESDPPKL